MLRPNRFHGHLRGSTSEGQPRWASILAMLFVVTTAVAAHAHDTWVQVSSRLVRPDDAVHADLFLGNHGNDHRDFKIAGKLGSLEGVTFAVVGPSGRTTDLVPNLVDLGYAPTEGFWSGRFVVAEEGLHCVSHSREGIRHGARGLKSGKAYFLAAERLDPLLRPAVSGPAPLGHPLELVPETDPVAGLGPGREIVVRLLLRGEPLEGVRVSFVPRGATLAEGFDQNFERTTDAAGRCRFTPKEGNLFLVVAHHERPEERGEGYEKTVYAATLVLDVPQRCGCCAGE